MGRRRPVRREGRRRGQRRRGWPSAGRRASTGRSRSSANPAARARSAFDEGPARRPVRARHGMRARSSGRLPRLVRSTASACWGRGSRGRGPCSPPGIRWAVEHGMHVVNLSLSTGARAPLRSVPRASSTRRTSARAMLVSRDQQRPPALATRREFAGVFSVAATDGTEPLRASTTTRTVPSSSERPGSTWRLPGSGRRPIRATGNSFAAPQIAGLIALILSKHPGLTPFQVKTVLAACAANAVGAAR